MNRSAFLVLTLIACGAEPQMAAVPRTKPAPIAGCETIDPHPCDVALAGCRERLFHLATCLRGQSIDEALEVLEKMPEMLSAHRERTYDLLNIIALGEADVALELLTPSSALIEDYVEALQDRELDFEVYLSPELSEDEQRARWTLLRGEARLHRARFQATQLGDQTGVELAQHFAGSIERARALVREAPSRYFAGENVFSAWGGRLAHEAWSKGQLPDLLANPPSSTRQFFVDGEVAPEPAPRPPEVALTQVETSTLGAYGVYLVTLDETIAAGVTSDLLWMYTDEAITEPNTSFVWKIQFADDPSAEKAEAVFADDLRDVLVARNGNKLAVTGSRYAPITPLPDP
jgi:hypothetical protein